MPREEPIMKFPTNWRSRWDSYRERHPKKRPTPESTPLWILRVLLLWCGFVLIDGYCALWLKASEVTGLGFSALWGLVFTALCLILPRRWGQLFFGLSYFFFAIYGAVQCGYNRVFGRMIWLSDINYADEGTPYLSNILLSFPWMFWASTIAVVALGILLVRWVPVRARNRRQRLACTALGLAAAVCIGFMPEHLFAQDEGRNATLSRQDVYEDLYDAYALYNFCGLYQTVFRDVYNRTIYRYTEQYAVDTQEKTQEITAYFEERADHASNNMTGLFQGKNVVLVLMESMDDWLIDPEHTPTIYRLMDEGINFTNFYTPVYGSARTYNTEFCINTGMFVPTDGTYTFDYSANTFNQSLASSFRDAGYTAKVFHYNSPDFYCRGIMEEAVGYEEYVSYEDYVNRPEELMNDSYMLQEPEVRQIFFRTAGTDQPFFNFVITRAAHLSYLYDEDFAQYALARHPEYYRYSDDEEVNCARAKAKLVDDMFADLLVALEEEGVLENTVIIAVTDHYTYGMEDINQVMELSGVDNAMELERTPFFIWSADCPDMEMDKVYNTSDFVPTVLNLFGLDTGYDYLGYDCFDPAYSGQVIFSTGEWITAEGAYDGTAQLEQEGAQAMEEDYIAAMNTAVQRFINVNNMLLRSDYYAAEPSESE